MNDPDAKDYKWLVTRERGEDIGDVPPAERAPYEELGALLAAGRPSGGSWKQRALDEIDALERAAAPKPKPAPVVAPKPAPVVAPKPAPVAAPKPVPALAPVVPLPLKPAPQRRLVPLIAGGLAAAAAVAIWMGTRPPASAPPREALALAVETRSGDQARGPVRGDPAQASVGDVLVVRAEAAGPGEVRVYGGAGDRLLARCGEDGGAGCTVTRDGERRQFQLEVPLRAPGTVRAVVFGGASLPAFPGALEPDLGAALDAKIPHKMQEPPIRVL